MFLSHMDVSLSFSLPPSLKSINISLGEDKKTNKNEVLPDEIPGAQLSLNFRYNFRFLSKSCPPNYTGHTYKILFFVYLIFTFKWISFILTWQV